MLKITDSVLKNLESQTSRTLVGEVCKVIEELEKQEIDKNTSLKLLKQLLKNKVYESYRSHTALIRTFSEGYTTFNIDFVKPNE